VTKTLRIEKAAHGGVFVARPEGKVVFVEGALPGELVEAEITQEAKSFQRSRITRVIESSEHRRDHFWPEAALGAGGADFGHIDLGYQRTIKSEILAESLARMAGVELSAEVLAVDESDGLGYRTRVQLHVAPDGTAGVKGTRSNEVIAVDSLPLANSEINELALHKKGFPGKKKIFIASSPDSLQWSIDGEVGGSKVVTEVVGGRVFDLGPGVFWQAHALAPKVLLDGVLTTLGNFNEPELLDLYSGAGLFAANIAARFPDARVHAVELSEAAVRSGKNSARGMQNLSFQKSDVLTYLRSRQEEISTVVLDPPRSGAATKVINQLVRLKAQQIIYVACDPVALARDIGLLRQAGYELESIQGYDIFPHTHHFETLASLRLSNLKT
jgi:tRNA/tmRNA/rRNA uracil-C5-methylase (TrmA/RlmC/RlmD family)